MMFDVWRNMFMVKMGTGQLRNIGMWLGIIPIHFFLTPPDFIPISVNQNSARIQ